MRLGFTGAHRSGKTTLARIVSDEYGVAFLQSPAGQIVKDFGFDMGRDNRLTFDFETEAGLHAGTDMQYAIYDTLVSSLQEKGGDYVSDRTPIDVAAYLLADATGYAGDSYSQDATVRLIEQAIRDTQRLYDAVILVPPLPDYDEEDGKPPLNRAYQEHHHMLCRGILFDEDLDLFWDEIRRTSFSLETRVDFVRATLRELGEVPVKVAA